VFSIGDDAHQCMEAIARTLPSSSTYQLKVYIPSKGFEDRIASRSGDPNLHAIVDDARRLRSLVPGPMPYWESLIRTAWQSPALEVIAKEALRHELEQDAIRVYSVAASDLSREALRHRVASLQPNEVLAFSSRITDKDGNCAHLPMLDFRVYPSKESLRSLVVFARAMGLSGAILESGKSYHYYAYSPVSQEGWIQFAALAILAYPVTDSRYLGHRLLSGSFDLRISTNAEKPVLPHVVAVVG
jgi:hypothetical protein